MTTPFLHKHPYAPFLFPEATKWIVGTLPPPRFTQGLLKEGDVDFCYGSRDGQLWPILDQIFNLGLVYETSLAAIAQRKEFLLKRKIGICDIISSAEREKIDASDLGMRTIILRDMVRYLQDYPKVEMLLFTGGNSKNGPEYLFRKLLKEHQISLEAVDANIPRIHKFQLTPSRTITTVSLTAPSGAANRAVGSLEAYKKIKDRRPDFTTFDFRVSQYRPYF
jgi:G:T/U-mismatch repair DNA glycosylase